MMSHRRKVLILGATGSIGKVVLKNLLLSNYQVVGIGFKKKKNFINNYLELKKVPYFDFYNCDLSKLYQVRNLIKKIIIKHRFIDTFVNCAGTINRKSFERETEKEFEKIFNTNFVSSKIIIKYLIKNMKKKNFGRIIHLSSQVSRIPHGHAGPSYEISKIAQNALSRNLAFFYGKYNIFSNSVIVGTVKSSMQNDLGEDFIKRIKSKIPLKRLGTADDIANLVNFLIGEKNGYINGACINISGGSVLD
jgi:NAD(P)-dependent dehydrogenase (short-subunit alcohol dehydrogenase family)